MSPDVSGQLPRDSGLRAVLPTAIRHGGHHEFHSRCRLVRDGFSFERDSGSTPGPLLIVPWLLYPRVESTMCPCGDAPGSADVEHGFMASTSMAGRKRKVSATCREPGRASFAPPTRLTDRR